MMAYCSFEDCKEAAASLDDSADVGQEREVAGEMFTPANPTVDPDDPPGEEEDEEGEDIPAARGFSNPAPLCEVPLVPDEALRPRAWVQKKEGLALDSEQAGKRRTLDPDQAESPPFSRKEEEEDRVKHPLKEPSAPSRELPKKITFGDSEEEKEAGRTHATAEKDQNRLPCLPLESRSLGMIPQPTPHENPGATGGNVSRGTSPKHKYEIPASSSSVKETVLRTETKAWLPKEDSPSSTVIYTMPKLALRGKEKSCHDAVGGSPGHLKEATTGSTSAMVNSLNSFVESPIGQVFADTIERALQKSEEWLNYYLPLPENREGPSGAADERRDTAFQDLCKEGCFVRINSLSTQLRNRAFKYVLRQLKATRQSTQENLSLLDQVLDLIDRSSSVAPTSFVNVPEKLSSMWAYWTSDQEPDGSKAPRRQKSDSISFLPEQLELKALSLTRILARELYTTYHNLLPHVPDLPLHLQEKASRVYESLEELQAQLSKSPSLRDLPAHLVVHSRQKIASARENLDEILDFMAKNPPAQWLSPASSSKAFKEPLFGEGRKSPEPQNKDREKDEESATCHTTTPPPPPPPPPPPHL